MHLCTTCAKGTLSIVHPEQQTATSAFLCGGFPNIVYQGYISLINKISITHKIMTSVLQGTSHSTLRKIVKYVLQEFYPSKLVSTITVHGLKSDIYLWAGIQNPCTL